MIAVPLTPLHASLVALSASGFDGGGDLFTFRIDPAQSQVQYVVESGLGACTLESGSEGNLEGTLEFVLHPGLFPVSGGQQSGGRCTCRPDLVGSIANPEPGRPALLQFSLESLVFTPRSQSFEIDAHGRFQAAFECEIRSGELTLSPLGGLPICVPLAGVRAQGGRAQGLVWIDNSGVHVLREITFSLRLDDPASDLDLRLRVQGLLRADVPLPVPLRQSAAEPDAACVPRHAGMLLPTDLQPSRL